MKMGDNPSGGGTPTMDQIKDGVEEY